MATIKAPAWDILRFAAYHLDAGAHRVWIYLDAPCPDAETALLAHPKCRVISCDETYWRRYHKRWRRKHQVRQCLNATHAYERAYEITWLAHIDADEFIVPTVVDQRIAEQLKVLPPACQTVRLRPMEALAPDDPAQDLMAFKAFVPPGGERKEVLKALYPDHSGVLNAGFLSHIAGKLFVRTGQPNARLRLHNFLANGVQNPGEIESDTLDLGHLHAANWHHWRAALDYRLSHGSQRTGNKSGSALHDFLCALIAEEGEAGLRQFFDAVCADTPEHRTRLSRAGLLRLHTLDLKNAVQRVFPAYSP